MTYKSNKQEFLKTSPPVTYDTVGCERHFCSWFRFFIFFLGRIFCFLPAWLRLNWDRRVSEICRHYRKRFWKAWAESLSSRSKTAGSRRLHTYPWVAMDHRSVVPRRHGLVGILCQNWTKFHAHDMLPEGLEDEGLNSRSFSFVVRQHPSPRRITSACHRFVTQILHYCVIL